MSRFLPPPPCVLFISCKIRDSVFCIYYWMKLFSKSTVSSRSRVAACKYVYHTWKQLKTQKFRDHSTLPSSSSPSSPVPSVGRVSLRPSFLLCVFFTQRFGCRRLCEISVFSPSGHFVLWSPGSCCRVHMRIYQDSADVYRNTTRSLVLFFILTGCKQSDDDNVCFWKKCGI